MSEPKLRAATISEQIMHAIREEIFTGQLAAGKRYSIDDVAERIKLDASRTPIREALLRLEDAGLVRIVRNRGVEIVKASLQNMQDWFQLRLMLEVPATRRAARHVDNMVLYELQKKLDAMARAVEE